MKARFATCLAAAWALAFVLAQASFAAELRAPANVTAGQAFTIQTQGSGDATFYLLGPNRVMKRGFRLGAEISIAGSDVTAAGAYRAIACGSDGCTATTFRVTAAAPARLSFFLHPSRVPVATPNSIDATAFVYDRYFNPVLTPVKVEFGVSPASGAAFSRAVATERGIAALQMNATAHEGPVHVTAAVGDVKEPRLIQQVASEACNLRMKATPGGKHLMVETEPVRDCSGNPLPDGTIVSFTKIDSAGKSTVDTPIKKGIARAQFAVTGQARISAACGVVLGNELAINGQL